MEEDKDTEYLNSTISLIKEARKKIYTETAVSPNWLEEFWRASTQQYLLMARLVQGKHTLWKENMMETVTSQVK